jgi:hypothetical protein
MVGVRQSGEDVQAALAPAVDSRWITADSVGRPDRAGRRRVVFSGRSLATTRTRAPDSARQIAVVSPATPAPTTSTSGRLYGWAWCVCPVVVPWRLGVQRPVQLADELAHVGADYPARAQLAP